jgi:hypothetical protein
LLGVLLLGLLDGLELVGLTEDGMAEGFELDGMQVGGDGA